MSVNKKSSVAGTQGEIAASIQGSIYERESLSSPLNRQFEIRKSLYDPSKIKRFEKRVLNDYEKH
jgi:hypothetical protein